MGSRTVTLLFCASLCISLLTCVGGQQPATEPMCYACTYRIVGEIRVGEFCNDPFHGAISPNVTCDTACVKRTTTGGMEQVKRGCYSDMADGAAKCETYYNREVPNTNPPQYVTQTCCYDPYCNHGSALTAQRGLVALALLLVGTSFVFMWI